MNLDTFYIAKWIGKLVLPPAGNVLLLVLGWWLVRIGWRLLGRGLAVFSLLTLLMLTLPWVGDWLMYTLERFPALAGDAETGSGAEAIVVLGMGRYEDAPEYAGDTVSAGSLERVRYGAVLARRSGLPVLVSGGFYRPRPLPEAELMRQVMEQEMHVPVRWSETESRNTQENAEFSRRLLEVDGIRRVYLVTHAWHMPRSMEAFRRAGLEPVPAPTAFSSPAMPEISANSLVPSARALRDSVYALHEWLGLIWYRYRYGGGA